MKIMKSAVFTLLIAQSIHAGAEQVAVSLAFDDYPQDISFALTREGSYVAFDTATSASEGSLADNMWGNFQSELANQTLDYIWNVPPGDYEFVIADAYGDGLCCNEGSGNYTVSVNGEVVHVSNGQFNSGETTALVVAPFDDDADGVDNASDNCTQVANPTQIDSNGDGIGNACDADLNNDCTVNVVDLGIFRSRFFSADPDADLNGDGTVNVIDLGRLRAAFFTTPGPSAIADLCDLPVVIFTPLSLFDDIAYDFDTGLEGPDDNAQMDVVHRRTSPTHASIDVINGASISLIGASRPSADDCLASTMSAQTVDLASVNINDWLCLRSNAGNIARFQVTGFDGASAASSNRIDISLSTWECASCELAYDPTPLAGLISWFDADTPSMIEQENGAVSAWHDRSGALSPLSSLTAAERPAFMTQGINGRGSLLFDGVDDRLFSSENMNLDGGYSVFVVARNDARQDYNGLLSLRPTTTGVQANFEMYWQVGSTNAASGNLVVTANRNQGGMGVLSMNNAGPAIGNTYIASAVVGGELGPADLQINGAGEPVMYNNSDMTPDATLPLCVGQGFGPSVVGNVLEGPIGEVLIFDRALSATETAFVQSYLEGKWL